MQQSIEGTILPKVCVLLSSYNGGKYIREQIDSILGQEDVEIELVIRDDGSRDNTVDIINSYGDKVKLIRGNNLGCEQSFAELLKYNSDADYYAFSDQDDYWLPRKVSCEVRAISKISGPALAACNLEICDKGLNIKKVMHSKEDLQMIREKMKRDYLCNMHGCVLLWNRMLHSKMCVDVPPRIVSHDGWVNTVANAIGTTIILDEPLIRYRIHDNNVAGHATSMLGRAIKGARIYLGKGHPQRDLLAKEVLIRFESEMNVLSNGYDTLKKIASYKSSMSNRIQLINKEIICKTPYPDRLLWMLSVLVGTF